ncbi:DNA repair protein RecN [Candidatus Desantisbacteria bacterium CG1_02_38_46]|uniref:DNA repair protein RecN n=3 Tax=unclassified Candidatus Desantisiibacteriota TaxID=3106372 RepID=A0A2H9PBS8_9BACT|nr:MAG: DNA repair protein RecN [Candidatus Desantisbacteria bacterium CG1_02_38_46]PIU51366.1 MAG: DNA repair protein RecN [Candidatus Desantisbacteria bacterium CG07_land_8_20_14_0_80_39_15]PIZ15440.1 MAG: DNA repair protein RecN [Candidatus Desantisbacteria bacterium CG_4_10_14_0_8_um_filter_39_17]
MLKGLNIENFAIIDNLSLKFDGGLNVFTGETGAGKTIIIEALSLILGEKVETALIRTGEEKAVISTLFDLNGDEIFIKREITSAGRGICYINEKIVSLNALKEIGNTLVDIHGQHEHQSLLKPDKHIDLLDRFGELQTRQEKITEIYNELKKREKRLDELKTLEKESETLRELFQFQVDEITGANLSEGDDVKIEKERLVLSSFQKLTEGVSGIYQELFESEGAIIDRLKKIAGQLQDIAPLDESIKGFLKSIDEASLSLQEFASELRKYRDGLEYDPQRIEVLTEKQDFIQKLKRKYGTTIREILDFKKEVEQKLKDISSRKEEIEKLTTEVTQLKEKCLKESQELSKKRKMAAGKLEENIEKELADLEMKKTKFKVQISESELGPKGIDRIEFLLSPNLGEDLRPLVKIASGGEMSRIMLALKSILLNADEIPVMVFDEIDLGIGGKTASSVGAKMKALSSKKQIICITHLAQIAAFGNSHFKVEKSVEKGRTKTEVNELNGDERVKEIARMISGDKITSTSLKHAKELLES